MKTVSGISWFVAASEQAWPLSTRQSWEMSAPVNVGKGPQLGQNVEIACARPPSHVAFLFAVGGLGFPIKMQLKYRGS